MFGYELIWGSVIGFCLISFALMSVKILYQGLPELREMFKSLEDEKKRRQSVENGNS